MASEDGTVDYGSEQAGEGGVDNLRGSLPVDGSTATVVLMVGAKLFLANCGDSAGAMPVAVGNATGREHGRWG